MIAPRRLGPGPGLTRPLAVAAFLSVLWGCEAPPSRTTGSSSRSEPATNRDTAPYQSDIEEGLGAAVAILVDTSGSMNEAAPGDSRPKYLVARDALVAMLDATEAVAARRTGFPIKVGIYSFSSSVTRLLPIQLYDRETVHRTLSQVPPPGGGTAIGDAMRAARPDLYKAGVFRKYILVVTDGENTTGRSPDDVARDIWRKSEGGVQIHFVAFDTSPKKFAFLGEVGGSVLGAANGGDLRKALDDIYQGKILAEAVDVEREPVKK